MEKNSRSWIRRTSGKWILYIAEIAFFMVFCSAAMLLIALHEEDLDVGIVRKPFEHSRSFEAELMGRSIEILENVQEQTASQKMVMKTYTYGNTNLTYLFVLPDKNEVYTNLNSSLIKNEDYEKLLKQIMGRECFLVLTDSLAKSSATFEADFNSWQKIVYQKLKTDFLFAVSVDTEYPVQDWWYQEQALYQKSSRRVLLGWLGLILGGLCSFSLFFPLTIGAGRVEADEEIHIGVFDRLYTEPSALLIVGIWGVGMSCVVSDIRYVAYENRVPIGAAVGFYTMFWFLIGYLSLVRRIKAGTLWENSLACLGIHCLEKAAKKSPSWILALLRVGKLLIIKSWQIVRRLLRMAGRILKGIRKILKESALNSMSTMVKLCIAFAVFFFLHMLLLVYTIEERDEFGLLLFVFLDFLLFGFLLYYMNGEVRIQKGLEKMSGGELAEKIDTKGLVGKQLDMANAANQIGEGLEKAVADSVKNERMKTELITNVSHDIKTPLTSIVNYVDLLKRENFEDPKIRGYLDILDEKAHRLKTLSEDVVEASRASTGNVTLELTTLDLVELLRQVIGEYDERFQEKRLVLIRKFPENPVGILADGKKAWRVLSNLFGNITKYSLEGTRVYVDVMKEESNAVLVLKNISREPLNIPVSELTERFVRGDRSRSTDGSGLGLSIAKSFTELMGGKFTLDLDGDLFKVTIIFPLQ